jgi:CCR4-NOT transcription complex subunit 4
LSKKSNEKMPPSLHANTPLQALAADDDSEQLCCPLCCERMDKTDIAFKPCLCGYQLCAWCWHQIMERADTDEHKRCPACRKSYDEGSIEFDYCAEDVDDCLAGDDGNNNNNNKHFYSGNNYAQQQQQMNVGSGQNHHHRINHNHNQFARGRGRGRGRAQFNNMSYHGRGGTTATTTSGAANVHNSSQSTSASASYYNDSTNQYMIDPSRKHLVNVRVIQRNLVYVVGIAQNICKEEVLRKIEFFGKYGTIVKLQCSLPNNNNNNNNNVNNSSSSSSTSSSSSSAAAAAAAAAQAVTGVVESNNNNNNNNNNLAGSAYVTFETDEAALTCIQCIDGVPANPDGTGRPLRACHGTTKYCNYFLRNQQCMNPECLYLHVVGSEKDSLTKEQMLAQYSAKKNNNNFLKSQQMRAQREQLTNGGGGGGTTTTLFRANSGGNSKKDNTEIALINNSNIKNKIENLKLGGGGGKNNGKSNNNITNRRKNNDVADNNNVVGLGGDNECIIKAEINNQNQNKTIKKPPNSKFSGAGRGEKGTTTSIRDIPAPRKT